MSAVPLAYRGMSNFMIIAWRQNISEDVCYILTTRKKDVHAFWEKKGIKWTIATFYGVGGVAGVGPG